MASSAYISEEDSPYSSSSSSSSASSSSSFLEPTMDVARQHLLRRIEEAKNPEEKALAVKFLEFYEKNVISTSQAPVDRSSIQGSGSTVKFYGYVTDGIKVGKGRAPVSAQHVLPLLPFTMVTPSNGVSVANDLSSFSLINAEGIAIVIYTNSDLFISGFGIKSGYKTKGGWHLFEGVHLQPKVQRDANGRLYRNLNCTKMTYWKEGPRRTALVNLVARMFGGPRYQLYRLPPEYYPNDNQISDFIMAAREDLQKANTSKQINMNAAFSAQELESAFKHFIFENSKNPNLAVDPNGMAAYIHENRSVIVPSFPTYVQTGFDEPLVTISSHQYSPVMVMMKDGVAKTVEASTTYPFTIKTQTDFVQSVKTMRMNMKENTIDATCLIVHARFALGERYYPKFGIVDPLSAAVLLSTQITDNKIRADLFPTFVSGTLDYGRTANMSQNSSPNFIGEDKIPEYGVEVVPWRVFVNIVAGLRRACQEITVERTIDLVNRKNRKAGITAINPTEASISPLVPTGKETTADGYCAKNNQTHLLTGKMAFNVTESPIFFVKKNGYSGKDRNPITRGAAANFRFYVMANIIHNNGEDYRATQDEFFALENGSERKKELDKKLDDYAKVHSQEFNKVVTENDSEVFIPDRAGAIPGIEFKLIYNIFAVSKELDGSKEWDAYCNFYSEEFSEEAIRRRMSEVKEINAKKIQDSTRSTLDDDELAVLEAVEKKSMDKSDVSEKTDYDTDQNNDDDDDQNSDEEFLNDDESEDLEIPDPSPPLEDLIQKTKSKTIVSKDSSKPSSFSSTSKKNSGYPAKQALVSIRAKHGKRLERMIEEGGKAVKKAHAKKNSSKRQNLG